MGGGDFDEGSKIAEFHTEILGFVSGRVGSILDAPRPTSDGGCAELHRRFAGFGELQCGRVSCAITPEQEAKFRNRPYSQGATATQQIEKARDCHLAEHVSRFVHVRHQWVRAY